MLFASRNRATALGNHVFLPDRWEQDTAVLAHELTHCGQYQAWGPLRYFARSGRPGCGTCSSDNADRLESVSVPARAGQAVSRRTEWSSRVRSWRTAFGAIRWHGPSHHFSRAGMRAA